MYRKCNIHLYCYLGAGGIPASTHTQALVLQEALHHIPNPSSDCMVRNVASRLAQSLHDQVTITSCLWAHFVRSRGIMYWLTMKCIQLTAWSVMCYNIHSKFENGVSENNGVPTFVSLLLCVIRFLCAACCKAMVFHYVFNFDNNFIYYNLSSVIVVPVIKQIMKVTTLYFNSTDSF